MKYQRYIPILVISGTTIMATIVTNESAGAAAIAFVCGKTADGSPATIAQTPRGNVPVIRWVSNYFSQSGYNPQTRCQMVSRRFQTYFRRGALNYLTTGWMNRQPVVCVANFPGGGCATNLPYRGLLFTLKSTSDPGTTLKNLLQVRQNSGSPLDESSSVPVAVDYDGNTYINVNEYLISAPVEPATNQPELRQENLF
ncbi:MAG TPA: hypothetical protein DDW76_34715 [Cyanobacteria bacterium UBA11369]|nr:hypothetical protein [Cyanobacteria bacterium UBA11371]HBE34706.1 hypothetical protein [Cyanobacteria bacterium UBA11368]HBE53765.1 hypothetical protein [Cyanobacteria bacterium UBA11369]